MTVNASFAHSRTRMPPDKWEVKKTNIRVGGTKGRERDRQTCHCRNPLNRFTPLVRTKMSSGGLPPSVVMRFSSIDCSVIDLSVLVNLERDREPQKKEGGNGRMGTHEESNFSLSRACCTTDCTASVISCREAYGAQTFNIDLSDGSEVRIGDQGRGNAPGILTCHPLGFFNCGLNMCR